MTWNYLEGQEQRGPVTEGDFESLVRTGIITDQTYVWREGMAEWLPYGQVRTAAAGSAAAPSPAMAANQVVCAECGGLFSPDQVIRHGNVAICAACKPIFLQKLKEGVAPTGIMNYAGFWVRAGAKILDGIILAACSMPITWSIQGFHPSTPPGFGRLAGSTLLGMVIGASYGTFFIGKLGATPGKMAAKLLVINPDGSKVSYAKAFGRFFASDYVSGMFTLCIGYMMAGWDEEKRALHDRICSTRVIRK